MNSKIQILRCEGLICDTKTLGCYIMVNKDLCDVITPIPSTDLNLSQLNLSEVTKISIPSHGDLKLILKLMNGDPLYMGSVSINIQSLPTKGFVWLPLSKTIDSDSISSLKSEVFGPKILISIEKPFVQIDNTQLYKLQIKKLEFVINQLEEKIKESQELYENEKKNRASLATSYETLKKQFDDYAYKAEIREISLIKLLEKKDKELQEQFNRANNFENKYQTILLEKESIGENISRVKNDKSNEVIQELNKELERFRKNEENWRNKEKKMIEEVEKIGKDWNEAIQKRGLSIEMIGKVDEKDLIEVSLKAQILELSEINKALTSKIKNLSEEREKLSSKLFELEEIQCQTTSFIVENKEPDLEDTLHALGVQELFSKSEDGYYCNSQKIQLSVENGKIVVNSLPVENFLQLSFQGVLEKSVLHEGEIANRTFVNSPKAKKGNLSFEGGRENMNKTVIVEKSNDLGITPEKYYQVSN